MLIAGARVIIAAGVACVTTLLLTPVIVRLAERNGALDWPGGRKRHGRPVPRLGGVAVMAGLGCGLAATWLTLGLELPSPLPRSAVLFAGSVCIIFLVGLADDLNGVRAPFKLCAQILAALILTLGSDAWVLHSVGLPGGGVVELGAFAIPVTVLWIVGVCNAINLIDGMDGLAAGVTAIIAGSFVVYAFLLDASAVAVGMACIIGATVGFLAYNRHPARIFLGDAGALTLGFLLAALSVRTAFKAPGAIGILVPFLALGLPAIDAILVAMARFFGTSRPHFRARVSNMLRADRTHLHHLLMTLLRGNRQVVRAVYGGVLLSAGAALLVVLTRSPMLGFAFLTVEALAIAGVRAMGLQQQAAEASSRARRKLKSDWARIQRGTDSLEEESPAARDADAPPNPIVLRKEAASGRTPE